MPKVSASRLDLPSAVVELAGQPLLVDASAAEALFVEIAAIAGRGVSVVDPEEVPVDYQGSIAVVKVRGFLSPLERPYYGTSLPGVAETARRLAANADVKTVVFWFDTPGGTFMQTPETHQAIIELSAAKRTVAYGNLMMTSGGYWLANACQEIFASQTCMVGSVGVIAVHLETSKLDEEIGYTFTVMATPPPKAFGNQFEQLPKEARATLEKRQAAIYDQFRAVVATGRGQTPEKVHEGFGQGRSFYAFQAEAQNMIDGVRSWNALLRELESGTARQTFGAKTQGVISMTKVSVAPEVMAALRQRGLADGDTSALHAHGTLRGFYAAQGKEVPDDAVKICQDLAAIKPPDDDEVTDGASAGAVQASASAKGSPDGDGARQPTGPLSPPAQSKQAGAVSADAGVSPVPATEEAKLEAARQTGAIAERKRCTEITALCAEAGIDPETTRGFLRDGVTLGDVQTHCIKHLAKTRKPVGDAGGADEASKPVDPEKVAKAEYRADKKRFEQLGVSEEEYVKSRVADMESQAK